MLTRRWPAVVGVAAIGVAAACGGGGSSGAQKPPKGVPAGATVGTVDAVVDADTLRIALTGYAGPSEAFEISLIGVERPAPGACLAAESDAFTARELPVGSTIYVLDDVQEVAADLSVPMYVWDGDGEFYNDKLLRQGFAKAAPDESNKEFLEQLAAAQSEAVAAGRGVWGCPPPTTLPPTTVAVRTVAFSATFSVKVGETVTVEGEGLSVTFVEVRSDSRCPSGVQCIAAGNAAIAVTVAKAGTAPATLTLNTFDSPTSAQYGRYKVDLVLLGRGQRPSATLRVT